MNIIGITGAIGHGKTSLAKAFLRQVNPARHTESSILISKVADKLNQKYALTQPSANDNAAINAWLSNLPDILREMLHYSGDIKPIHFAPSQAILSDPDFQKLAEYLQQVEQNHALIAQEITPGNKDDYRAILQWLGAYVTKHIGPTLWYDELLRQAHQAEADGFRLFVIGGVRFPSDAQVIHQAGGKIVAIERPDKQHEDMTDPTEAYRSLVPVDTTVINDGTLGALDHVVFNLWKDLEADDIQPRYQASRMAFDAPQSPHVDNRDLL